MSQRALIPIGHRAGRLTVIGEGIKGANGQYRWPCRCDCGNVSNPATWQLLHKTRSCGCARDEKVSRLSYKHGGSKTREFKIWAAMRRRCSNLRDTSFQKYGGRGVKVCERWESFENFYADMGPRPSPAHSVERIDNSGNYEPGNCRWATPQEQGVNTRQNVRLTFGGKTMTMGEWARAVGLSSSCLSGRLKKGWSLESALTTPSRSRNSRNAWEV